MTFAVISGRYLPWGPFGGTFWGGFWAPPPGLNPGISDITGESNLTARVIDYGVIALDWDQPVEEFDVYTIVRSTTGYPLTLTDGMVVVTGSKADNITNYDDYAVAAGYAYYSMFIRLADATPGWVRVSQAFALMPLNNKSGEWFWELLPDWYRVEDEKTGGHPTNVEMAAWGHLRRFMELLGRSYDGFRAEADSLLNVYDPRYTRADLLEYFAAMFGFLYEPHIGYSQMRAIMANWFEILKTKGTLPGVDLYVQSTMGYQTTIALGEVGAANLMLTPNDSEAAQTIGQWRRSPFVTPNSGSIVNTPYTPAQPYLEEVPHAYRVSGITTDSAWICGDPTSSISVRLTALPIKEATQYMVQVAFRAIESYSVTPVLYARYFNSDGIYLDYDSTGGTPFDDGEWTVSTMPLEFAEMPVGTAFAMIELHVDPPVNNQGFMFTGVMISEIDPDDTAPYTVPSFQGARTVSITMHPTRVNFIPNPSFEHPTASLLFQQPTVAATTTLTHRGSGTPTTSGLTWATTTNAVDGTPPANPGTYATWSSSVSEGVAYIEISGYDFTAIGAQDRLESIDVRVRNTVNAPARFATMTFQPYSGTTPLGTPVTVAPTAPAHDNTGTFTGISTAQLKAANFKIRVTVARAVDIAASVFSLDHVDVTANYHVVDTSVTLARSSEKANAVTSGTYSMKITLAPGTTDTLIESSKISIMVLEPNGLAVPFAVGDVWTFGFTLHPESEIPSSASIYPYARLVTSRGEEIVRSSDIFGPNVGYGWAQLFISVEIITELGELMAGNQLPYVRLGIGIEDSPAGGASYYIDTLSLERNAHIYQYSYFDGSSDLTSEDFMWDAEVHNSPSLYYPNKHVREARLEATIEDFLPPLCAYEIYYELPSA